MIRLFFSFLISFSSLRAEGIIESLVSEGAIELTSSVIRWCSYEKSTEFAELVLEVKPEVCVEIGTFGGGSLLPVAFALKALGKGVIIGIDPWNNEVASRHFDPILHTHTYDYWQQLDFRGVYQLYNHVLQANQLGDYVINYMSSSEKAAPHIPPIDILHIDGSLSEVVCEQDVSLYLSLVRPGGFIWISNATLEERQGAIEMLEEACDFVKTIEGGNCALFKKR